MASDERWFTGEHFRRGQHFETFVTHPAGHILATERLRRLLGNKQDARLLEVGPGNAPLIKNVPGEKYYLEPSLILARQLRREGGAVLVGGIEDVPVSRTPHFDVAVAAEVLTHVPEERRVDALARLAGRSKMLLVIDRAKVPADQARYELKSRMLISALAHPDSPAAMRGVFDKEAPDDAVERDLEQRVDFGQLAASLRKKGFNVEVEPISHRGVTFAIMTAKRA